MTIDPKIEAIFYKTTDPEHFMGIHPVPAMTTLLYRVCDQDQTKFEEACRLIGLFIVEALKEKS